MAAELRGCRPAVYSRRHPEQTVLYHIVQHHLETYLMLARAGDWDGHAVPAYVERDFRRYQECGILAYGFARASARTAVVTSWWLTLVRGALSVRPVLRGGWPKPPRISSIMSFRRCRCANGSCRYQNACASAIARARPLPSIASRRSMMRIDAIICPSHNPTELPSCHSRRWN